MRTMGSGGIVAFPGDRGGTAKDTKNTKGEKRIGGWFQLIRVSYVFAFLVVYRIDVVDRLGCGAGWQ